MRSMLKRTVGRAKTIEVTVLKAERAAAAPEDVQIPEPDDGRGVEMDLGEGVVKRPLIHSPDGSAGA